MWNILGGFWRNRRWQIFSDGYQSVWLTDYYPFPSALGKPLLLPAAKYAADCVERCTCHLSQILSGKRNTNQHSTFHLPTSLADQSQQRSGHSPLYPLCCQFSKTILQLPRLFGHQFQGIDSEPRVLFHEPNYCLTIPKQRLTRFYRLGRYGVFGHVHGGENREHLPRACIPYHYLMSVRCQLGEFDLSSSEKVEKAGRIALVEEESTALGLLFSSSVDYGRHLSGS